MYLILPDFLHDRPSLLMMLIYVVGQHTEAAQILTIAGCAPLGRPMGYYRSDGRLDYRMRCAYPSYVVVPG